MMTVILGPPGTGKTHYLVNEAERILKNTSIKPERVGYFSFTKRAATEAKMRAIAALGLPQKRFVFFSTLHSMAFGQLGYNRNLVFGGERIERFANWASLDLSKPRKNSYTTDETWPEKTPDDHALFLMNQARVSRKPLDWDSDSISQRLFWRERYVKACYERYKQSKYLYDFTDMLERLIVSEAYPDLDVIIIDESQDMSPLQWEVVYGLIEHNPNAPIFLAGDDDQAIYEWAGASVEIFQDRIDDADKVIELVHSHRVPAAAFAVAKDAIGYCKHRRPKQWKPAERRGRISYADDYGDIQWNLEQSYLVLARNTYLLKRAVNYLNEYKLPWSWLSEKHGRGYEPIRVSTIHGAKGTQADNVILDLGMSKAAYNEGWTSDAEARVWYVAVTRTKNDLIFMDAANSRTSSLYIGSPFSYSAYIGN